MQDRSFLQWLRGEAFTTRCALLIRYEQQEKLRYLDGPRLEKEYMDRLGAHEEAVIRAEIECQLLQRKQQLVQAALNRQEPIDEAAIEAALEAQRRQLLQEAAGPAAPQPYAELSAEQSDELQRLYRGIVRDFHPQLHPGSTDAHRQLYEMAQEAYRRRDLAALRLIHETLYDTPQDAPSSSQLLSTLALLASLLREMSGDLRPSAQTFSVPDGDSTVDYTLAGALYSAFLPTAEELAVKEEWARYQKALDEITGEIADMQRQFPYSAAEMLSDPAKVEAYQENLAHRLFLANAERERRTAEIRAMIESAGSHD